jgi:hypothetical protein
MCIDGLFSDLRFGEGKNNKFDYDKKGEEKENNNNDVNVDVLLLSSSFEGKEGREKNMNISCISSILSPYISKIHQRQQILEGGKR